MNEAVIFPALAGAVLIGLIVQRPLLGACLFLIANPLIVGIARGELGVDLRPNELLLLLVLGAVGLRVLLLMLSGRFRPAPLDGMDLVLLALVVTGSLLPVLSRSMRGLPLSTDDLMYAVVLVKYYALFRLFRGVATDAAAVAACLRAALAASAVVAVIALLETFRLFGVAEFLHAHYDQPFTGSEGLVAGRATATVASVFGLADLMIISLLIALALRRVVRRGRPLLGAAALLFAAGCAVTGTFSGYIGLAVGLLAFGAFTGSLHRLVPAGAALGGIAALALWPIIEQRVVEFSQPSGMPSSWQGRMANLQDYFLPQLQTGANWLLGVQPAARLPAPETWRDWIYIESGYVWLLWIGGVPFLVAFLVFVLVALRRFAAVARARRDEVGAAALAGRCAVVVIAVLMLFDPHLTIRGGADLFFPLLALGLAPLRHPVGQPVALQPHFAPLPAQRRLA